MYDHYDRELIRLAHARSNRDHGGGETAQQARDVSAESGAETSTGWWIFAWILDLISLF